MWSKAVKELPKYVSRKDTEYIDVINFLENILNNHLNKYEQIFWEGEYASAKSAYNSLRRTIRINSYPMIVHSRGEEIYIERRDI